MELRCCLGVFLAAVMQLSTANDVKVYNLSAGKSLPEWLEERERRKKAGKPATAGGDSR